MVKAFKIYGKPESEIGTIYDRDSAKSESVGIDDDQDDNEEFPDSTEDFEEYHLPNHERCATHSLHLIASRDVDKIACQGNSYKKIHDSGMTKCQAVWNPCSRSPKACETYLDCTEKSPISPCPTR